jgi:hypothetical protein
MAARAETSRAAGFSCVVRQSGCPSLRLGVLVNVFENKIDEAALGARNHT